MTINYIPRITDSSIELQLQASGAVLVQGPKWCGKTTSAAQFAKSALYMADPAMLRQNLLAADMTPGLLLEGETPRLLDEWQVAPKLWDAVRYEVDRRGETGQFILTGSATPDDHIGTRIHSGVGRISRVTMRTMSLAESGDSTGKVSLGALFRGETDIAAKQELSFEDYATLICRGGWPQAVGKPEAVGLLMAQNYMEALLESELSSIDGVSRNPQRVRALLRSLARHVGASVSNRMLYEDIRSNEKSSLSVDSVASYLQVLKRGFVLEDLPAWSPRLRSRTVIRTSDTRYFADPSIGAAALRIGPRDLLNDLMTMGFYFESMCIRDLRVYAQALDGDVYHYRDKSGLECDAVVHLRNGEYALIEVKLGDRLFPEAAANLKRLCDLIDGERMPKPRFMMILTAMPYAYQLEEGIFVVPLACLGK